MRGRVLVLLALLLGTGTAGAAEPMPVTVAFIRLDATTLWSPSRLKVQQGETVTLRLRNTLDEPHGFTLAAVELTEVVPPHAEITVTFAAPAPGTYFYRCHLHSTHFGGQLVVISP